MSSLKILVVNDDDHTGCLCSMIFSRAGHRTISVSGGREALTFLAKRSDDLPDLILMDYMMPEMCGDEVIRRIRAQKPLRQIVIAMFCPTPPSFNWLALGVAEWIVQPLNPPELIAIVNGLFANRGIMM